MVAPAWLWVAASHSRTSPSSPPAARNFPPGLNASALTAAGPAAMVVPASCWVVASHSWTVPSLLAAATVAPSGLNVTASTGLRSELIGAPISCWVATSHSRTFPSPPPVASVAPSGLNAATAAAPPGQPGQRLRGDRGLAGQAPHPDGRGPGYFQGLAAAGESERERRAAPGRGAEQAM